MAKQLRDLRGFEYETFHISYGFDQRFATLWVLQAYREYPSEGLAQLVARRRRSTLRDGLPGHGEHIEVARDRCDNGVGNTRLPVREVSAPKLKSV